MTEPEAPVVVKQERRDNVLILTLDRPEARNAVNGNVARQMEAALDAADADDSIWVVIVTHDGPVFSAGADLRAIGEGRGAELSTKKGGFAGLVKRERIKPLIVAADGPALAGGCEILLSADLVVASTNLKVGVPEVKRCLVAAAGGLFRLARKIPYNIAMECVLTGDPISAERAEQFGLVNVLTEPGQVLDAALALAARVAANAPVAVQQSRQVVAHHAFGSEDEAWKASGAAMAVATATEDVQEGVAAFLEKRAPHWKGR
ncbi:MAG TPA: crotonase/enoyl-CoA hydratase family protein [Mycobacteriales bacterium]